MSSWGETGREGCSGRGSAFAYVDRELKEGEQYEIGEVYFKDDRLRLKVAVQAEGKNITMGFVWHSIKKFAKREHEDEGGKIEDQELYNRIVWEVEEKFLDAEERFLIKNGDEASLQEGSFSFGEVYTDSRKRTLIDVHVFQNGRKRVLIFEKKPFEHIPERLLSDTGGTITPELYTEIFQEVQRIFSKS